MYAACDTYAFEYVLMRLLYMYTYSTCMCDTEAVKDEIIREEKLDSLTITCCDCWIREKIAEQDVIQDNVLNVLRYVKANMTSKLSTVDNEIKWKQLPYAT